MSRIIRTEKRRTNLVFQTANSAFDKANNSLANTGGPLTLNTSSFVISSNISATGNIISSANVVASGYFQATGNIISSANVVASGYLQTTGNVTTSSNVVASGYLQATGNVVSSANVIDIFGNVREIPPGTIAASCTNYTLVISDSGKYLNVTTAAGGSFVTIPASTFNAGQLVRIYNSGPGNVQVKPAASVVLHTPNTFSIGLASNTIVGATGSRNVAPQGIATVMCIFTNTFLIHGPGVNSAIGGS